LSASSFPGRNLEDPLRKDLAPLGYTTNVWLALVIGVSVLGALFVLAEGSDMAVTYALVGLLWVAVTGGSAICFLRWLYFARRNAASYGPGGVGAFRQWTVGGWLCPVVNLWIPYRVLADVLRATAPGESGPPPVLAAPPERPAGTRVLRLWCAAWHAMWLALLTASFSTTSARVSWLAELAFLVLSIGAAACMIGIVTTVTRGQARREADPYIEPASVPQAAPAWFWVAVVPAFVIFMTVSRHLPLGHLAAFRDLFVP
jgi:hypothetical protein